MSAEINLTQIEYGRSYKVTDLSAATEYSKKLEKLGFTKGTLLEKSPATIHDPITIKIRGSRIALRRNEAAIVKVRMVK